MLKNQKVYFNLKNLCLSSFRRFAQSQAVKGEESHYDILGVKKNASLDEIKKAYRDLSKVHHPDVSKDPGSVEKFKKISNAYTVLKDNKARKDYDAGRTDYEQPSANTYKYNASKTQNTYWNDKQTGKAEKEWAQRNRSGLTEEEILYETIFGKTFKEDPLFYYRPENEILRQRYKEEIEKVYAKRKAEQGANYKGPGAASTASESDYSESAEWREFMREFYQKRYEDQTGKESGDSGLGYKVEEPKVSKSSFKFISGFLLLCTGGVVYALTAERSKTKSKYENTAQPLSSIQLEELREQHLKREEARKEQKKADFTNSLALMKKYPRKNPNAVNMLIDYTIWNDIKIYTVPYTYFHFEDEDLCRLTNDFEKNRIFNLKINTMLTYALEVERTFKNIYVKVDDVLDSLKKTGMFEPPGAFIRYYGYIFAKIRRKPIIWENLQQSINNGDKTISVFDLFFRYSTPILIANDEYYEIPIRHSGYVKDTTTSEGMGWIGNVHINHRPLEKKLFVPGEKNIFMWRGTKAVNAEEDRYLRTWGAYYEEYKKLKSTL